MHEKTSNMDLLKNYIFHDKLPYQQYLLNIPGNISLSDQRCLSIETMLIQRGK